MTTYCGGLIEILIRTVQAMQSVVEIVYSVNAESYGICFLVPSYYAFSLYAHLSVFALKSDNKQRCRNSPTCKNVSNEHGFDHDISSRNRATLCLARSWLPHSLRSSIHSICPSVCPSHACYATKRKDLLPIFHIIPDV